MDVVSHVQKIFFELKPLLITSRGQRPKNNFWIQAASIIGAVTVYIDKLSMNMPFPEKEIELIVHPEKVNMAFAFRKEWQNRTLDASQQCVAVI